MNPHRAGMDYLLEIDERTDVNVDALLAAANALARASRAKNGSDALQLQGVRRSIKQQLDKANRKAA